MVNFITAKYDEQGNRVEEPNPSVFLQSPMLTLAQLVARVRVGFVGTAFVTDVGKGTLFISDGSEFYPVGRFAGLYKCAVPVGLPSSGSVGANGALSLTTALDKAYPNGIYLYFQAGALYAGSVAGYYYTVMSLNNSGTVYNNLLGNGAPTRPANPTPIVSASIGAYTQVTASDLTGLTLPIPAGLLGTEGSLEAKFTWVTNNSANGHSFKTRYDNYLIHDVAYSNNTFAAGILGFTNITASVQKGLSALGVGLGLSSGIASTQTTGAVDSTTDKNLTVAINNAVATDWSIISGFELALRK